MFIRFVCYGVFLAETSSPDEELRLGLESELPVLLCFGLEISEADESGVQSTSREATHGRFAL